MDGMESLLAASFQEAERLQRSWVGEEHLLVALAKDPNSSRAREALLACGLDEAVITERVENMRFEPEPPALAADERPSPNPHYYKLWGRAEGLAIANSESLSPEHLLLAMIWDESSVVGAVLRTVDRTPADLLAALADLGVPVPARVPPVE